MKVFVFIILFIIQLAFYALLIFLLGLGIWTLFKDPSMVKKLLRKIGVFSSQKEERSSRKQKKESSSKQDEKKPLLEETIRSVVKEEVGRMGNIIIRSFPQLVNVSQADIVNEIRYNRQLLEHLMASVEKMNKKEKTALEKFNVQPYPIVKYARMVDSSSPLGFRMESLSDESKGACYKLILTSATHANYRLITDMAIQGEIIAMFNPIITFGCEYDEEPIAVNEIIHIDDGLLELNSGIWCIKTKTKIKFE